MRRMFAVVTGVATALTLAAGTPAAAQREEAAPRARPGADGPPEGGERQSPLRNPEGTLAGLAPVADRSKRAEATRLIWEARVAPRGPKTGYTRERYGEAWSDAAEGVALAGNGCNTRDDILTRDGEEIEFAEGSDCRPMRMRLSDAYTGERFAYDREHDVVEVDHVVPLSFAWRMGSGRWSREQRLRFANDPLNLFPVRNTVNQDKHGAGPAAWLPPLRQARCAYVVRFAQVALRYDLPVPGPAKSAMLDQC